MDDAATRALIQRLLASDAVWDETKDELKEYLAELDRGELSRADATYIEKMAARLDGRLPDAGADGDDDYGEDAVAADDDRIPAGTLAERFYGEVWNQADEAVAREILHADFVFHASLDVERQGVDGFIDYLRAVHAALDGFTCEIEALLPSGSQAAARMRFHGTHRGPLFGVDATGKRIEWTGAAFFSTDGQQITELWVLGDVDAVKRQLGVSPDAVGFDGSGQGAP